MGSIIGDCESHQNEISALITRVNGGDFALGQGGDLHSPLFMQKSFTYPMLKDRDRLGLCFGQFTSRINSLLYTIAVKIVVCHMCIL